MKRPSCVLLFVATLSMTVAASAQPRSSDAVAASAQPRSSDAVAAQLFFQRGREAAARGDAADACKNFEESLRLDLAVGTLFNLARCEEDLGRFASAWQHLREGIDRLEDDDPRRAQAVAAVASLDPRVPRLEVRLAPGAGGRVRRDGVELSSLSLSTPLPVNPGRHVVTVRADGRADATFEITLAEGQHATLVVAPGPVAEPPLPGLATHGESRKTGSPAMRTVGWGVGGAGAAALGVGLVTGALALERSSVVHDRCDDSRTCDERGLAALESSKELATVTTVALSAGAALVVAGVVLWVSVRSEGAARSAGHLPVLRF